MLKQSNSLSKVYAFRVGLFFSRGSLLSAILNKRYAISKINIFLIQRFLLPAMQYGTFPWDNIVWFPFQVTSFYLRYLYAWHGSLVTTIAIRGQLVTFFNARTFHLRFLLTAILNKRYAIRDTATSLSRGSFTCDAIIIIQAPPAMLFIQVGLYHGM